MLIDMPIGTFPMALGVIYDDPRPTFESAVRAQNEEAAAGKPADLQALVAKGQTWQVDQGAARDLTADRTRLRLRRSAQSGSS